MHKGLFVVFEGLDGCGKSVTAKLVAKKLEENGYKVILTREPGGTEIAEKIRNIILEDHETEKLEPTAEALLFAAARAQHTLTKIQPKVDEGYIVISDRWLASSLAYQGYARALGVGAVENINDFGIRNYRPDIQYFLDTPVEVCQQRINKRKEKDRMEEEDNIFYYNIYNYFIQDFNTNNYVKRINGNKSLEEIVAIIYDDILAHI